MKRTLIVIAAALLAAASCTEADQVQEPETVSVNLSAVLDEVSATKASFDNDGMGVYADQCRLQIWWGNMLYYEKTVPVTSLTAKFEDIVLVKDQKYDFLFWADNKAGAYYVTDTLTNVRLAGSYVGNKDERDAFFAALPDKNVTAGFSETVQLHRPFGQLNVISIDIPTLSKQSRDAEQLNSLVPNQVSLAVTVPTAFNVKTGEAFDLRPISYAAPVYTSSVKTETGAKNTLSMDYFFAPSTEGNLIDVSFCATNTVSGLANIDNSFPNVPIRRNYRTNIIGSLITVTGQITVEIQPNWTGEIDY